MKKEKTLKEKMWSVQNFEKIDWKKRTKVLFVNDVKEFIKKLKDFCKENPTAEMISERIDMLAGDLK